MANTVEMGTVLNDTESTKRAEHTNTVRPGLSEQSGVCKDYGYRRIEFPDLWHGSRADLGALACCGFPQYLAPFSSVHWFNDLGRADVLYLFGPDVQIKLSIDCFNELGLRVLLLGHFGGRLEVPGGEGRCCGS